MSLGKVELMWFALSILPNKPNVAYVPVIK